tara:strand:+ start:232 stop:2454 length:2223 start_codon:yes stop_codon:yes gene_type:complete
MNNSSQLDDTRPIAGEPANDSPIKPIPPLDGGINVEQDESNDKIPKKRRIMLAIQTISIIVALILSAYSFTIIDSLDDTTSKSGNDAAEVLVRTEGREADHICTEGGADIFIGNDSNRNGILEEDEVTSTTRLCHGKEGLSGPQGATGPNGISGFDSLVNTTVIDYGNESCMYGGLLISVGLDLNDNDTLDAEEITSSEFICNGMIGANGINGADGTSGHSALVERIDPPQHLCSNGFVINFGVDNGNGDGIADDEIMHDDEIVESLKICSEPLNFGPISDFFVGVSDGYSSQCSEFAWSTTHSMVITSGSDSASGCELWTSHGTFDTTQQLIDINPGNADSSPGLHLGFTSITVNDEELWLFDANSGVNGRELWISNLSASGTQQLTGYSGDGIIADSVSIIWMNGLVFSDSNYELMWTDGVSLYNLFDAPFIELDAQILLDPVQNKISSHTSTTFVVDESGIWFSGIHDDIGFEMHYLSNDGQLMSWNLNSFEDSSPNAILSLGQSTILVADDGINGRQLVELQTDGSHSWLTSMTLQSNGNPPTNVGENLGLNLLANKIIFDAQISGVDPTVWSYDLLSGSVTELSSIMVAPSDRVEPVILDNRIWFDCITGSTAEELCVSDGTTTGTKVIHEFQPGMNSAEIRGMMATDNHLLIIANGEEGGLDTGHCLWSFDVTTLQVELVYDPWSGIGNNSDAVNYGDLFGNNELVMFVADDGISGHELHLWSPLTLNDEWLIW